MTWWAPMQVYNFALKAGFPRDHATKATAVAFASSGGADHYQWTHPTTPGVDQRGLYALDVSRVGDDDASSLYDPVQSSEWAYALWKHYGEGWHWHPAYTANKGAVVRAFLMALNEDRGWMNQPAQFYNRTRSIARPWSMADKMHPNPLTAGAITPAEQETLWPTTTE